MKSQLDIRKWMRIFERNKQRRAEPRWDSPVSVPTEARAALFRSLAEFQLGDGGGPAGLIAWNAERYRQSQPGLAEVIDAWFTEEKEHSRLLGDLISHYDTPAVKECWSFSLFLLVRKLFGLAFELQILTVTELSSTAYYQMLSENCEDLALRDVCALILRDEHLHLAFQHDRLLTSKEGFSPLWSLQFRLCGWMAATVLWMGHGRCLRGLGVTRQAFFQRADAHFLAFSQRLHPPSRNRTGSGGRNLTVREGA